LEIAMDRPSLDAVIERLELLEREKRQVLWVGAALFAAAVVAVASGTDWVRRPKQIEAERFVLKDKDGKVRARLSTAPDGSPMLALLDAQGRDHLMLHGSIDDTATLSFYDHGQPRVTLSSTNTGAAGLNFYDKHDRSATGLYLWPDSTTGLGLRNGELGIELAAQADGLAGLSVVDQSGKVWGQLGALPQGVQHGSPLRLDNRPPFRDPATPTTEPEGPSRATATISSGVGFRQAVPQDPEGAGG
jgi:hypothetical protein